jgi:hypothetical protein
MRFYSRLQFLLRFENWVARWYIFIPNNPIFDIHILEGLGVEHFDMHILWSFGTFYE